LLSRLVGTPAAAPTASSPVGSDSFDGSDPRLTAIAAVAANGVIGDGAGLLWRLPEDLAHFKRTTLGGVLLLGRRTYDSLGVALPGRQLIVISRAAGPGVAYCPLSEDNLPKGGPAGLDGLIAAGLERFEVQAGRLLPRPGPAPAFAAGVFVASSPDLALRLLAWYPERTWWCAGGGQIYAALWPYTTDLDLTEVHASVAGAVSFPVVDPVYWIETRRQEGGEFDFVGYRRRTFDARQRLAEIMVSAPRPDPGDA
jgi:dihydrofolate reductase